MFLYTLSHIAEERIKSIYKHFILFSFWYDYYLTKCSLSELIEINRNNPSFSFVDINNSNHAIV